MYNVIFKNKTKHPFPLLFIASEHKRLKVFVTFKKIWNTYLTKDDNIGKEIAMYLWTFIYQPYQPLLLFGQPTSCL